MSLLSYSFVDKSGKILQVLLNTPVPAGFRPLDQNPSGKYTYYDVATKKTFTLPPGMPSTGLWILKGVEITSYNISKGEAYDTGNGTVIVPPGSPVPIGWTPTIQVNFGSTVLTDVPGIGVVAVDSSTNQSQDIPPGSVAYQTPNSGIIIVPKDKDVPSSWVVADANPTNTDEIYQNDANGAEVVNDANPGAFADPLINLQFPPPPPQPSNLWKIIGGVIVGAGALGLAYLGYLAWKSPHQLAKVVETSAKTAGFIITIAQALAAVAIIGALSFVGYEFLQAMDANNGDVAKSIGSMLASTIETFVEAIVDAVEQLAKDAWNFVITEIKSILPSWL